MNASGFLAGSSGVTQGTVSLYALTIERGGLCYLRSKITYFLVLSSFQMNGGLMLTFPISPVGIMFIGLLIIQSTSSTPTIQTHTHRPSRTLGEGLKKRTGDFAGRQSSFSRRTFFSLFSSRTTLFPPLLAISFIGSNIITQSNLQSFGPLHRLPYDMVVFAHFTINFVFILLIA